MDFVLLLARLALAAVFVVAGIGKLADLPGSRKAVRDFGVPERLAPAAGLLLPIAELVVAVALLPAVTARWGALGALALLLVFIGGIGYNLARGQTPDCHCFGQIHSAPAGWPTIGRNAALAAVALFVVVAGWSDAGTSTVAWLGDLSGAGIALTIGGLLALALLGGVAWVVVNLIGQNGRLLLRIEAIETAMAAGGAVPPPAAVPSRPAARPVGLPVGAPAPAFSLPNLDDAPVSLDALRAGGRSALLLFTDPNCGPCNTVLRDVPRWEAAFAGRIAVVVLSRGSPWNVAVAMSALGQLSAFGGAISQDPFGAEIWQCSQEANLAKRQEHGLSTLVIQPDRSLSEAYQVSGTPAAVLVTPDGQIGAPTAGGIDAIRTLVASLAGVAAPASPAPDPTGAVAPATANGSPAPAFTLPDLDGHSVALQDLLDRGQPVALYFTDPECDPCDVLLPDLGRWQRDYADRVTVAIVSRGTPDANRAKTAAHGIANVLLQNDMELIEEYGISQAPAVVIVRPDGTRDGEPAYGDPQIRIVVAKVANAPELRPEVPKITAGGESRLTIRDAVPSIELPAIGGELADLANVRGAETVLLFWSPTCGYCLRMLDDLKAWEASRPVGSPRLVVVSAGSAAMTQAHGFRSPVVLDNGLGVGRRFGTRGTPAAIRIDAEGRVASPVAAGATAVLGLLQAGSANPAPARNGVADPTRT